MLPSWKPSPSPSRRQTSRPVREARPARRINQAGMIMIRISRGLLCAALALGISGCTIVQNAPDGEKAIAADASGDDARTAMRIEDTFDSVLLPYVRDHATPMPELRSALSEGVDAAGAKLGRRGSGEGAAWNFPISGTGRIVAAKLDTRARTIGLDADGDGVADVTVQLGPVIKGSSLRDMSPFYDYDDFRDQIEFAKLSRAINDRISGLIEVPEGDLMGQMAGYVGVVSLKSATDAFVVTPISVEVRP